MRDPDTRLDSPCRGVLKRTLNQFLARLGLDVFERVVDVVEEVGRGEDLGFDVAHGAVDFVEHVVEAAADDVGEFVERVAVFALFGV